MIKFLHTTLVISLLVLFNACGPTEAEKEAMRQKRMFVENPIQWDTLMQTSYIPFQKDSINASYTINISYLYPQEYQSESVKSNLHRTLSTLIWGDWEADITLSENPAEKVVADYINKQKELYTEQLNYQIPLWNGINGDSLFSAIQNIETRILYNEANFISYQVSIENFRGKTANATPTIEILNISLDLTNGHHLTEADIFVENHEEPLNKLLSNKILEIIELNTSNELEKSKYRGADDISCNNNFYLNRDGIHYTFNPQEYTDASLGILTISLSYNELKDILKPGSPLSIFTNSTETNK